MSKLQDTVVFKVLRGADDPMTVGALAEETGLERSEVKESLARLREAGKVVRSGSNERPRFAAK